jgi:hypothetical protein
MSDSGDGVGGRCDGQSGTVEVSWPAWLGGGWSCEPAASIELLGAFAGPTPVTPGPSGGEKPKPTSSGGGSSGSDSSSGGDSSDAGGVRVTSAATRVPAVGAAGELGSTGSTTPTEATTAPPATAAAAVAVRGEEGGEEVEVAVRASSVLDGAPPSSGTSGAEALPRASGCAAGETAQDWPWFLGGGGAVCKLSSVAPQLESAMVSTLEPIK